MVEFCLRYPIEKKNDCSIVVCVRNARVTQVTAARFFAMSSSNNYFAFSQSDIVLKNKQFKYNSCKISVLLNSYMIFTVGKCVKPILKIATNFIMKFKNSREPSSVFSCITIWRGYVNGFTMNLWLYIKTYTKVRDIFTINPGIKLAITHTGCLNYQICCCHSTQFFCHRPPPPPPPPQQESLYYIVLLLVYKRSVPVFIAQSPQCVSQAPDSADSCFLQVTTKTYKCNHNMFFSVSILRFSLFG